jgi:hypothetical protein
MSWCCFRSPARSLHGGRFAAEIPDTEKRRAGLDGTIRLWIVLDEYNHDVIGRSFYLEPEPPLGYFSKAFFLPLLLEFIRRKSQARAIPRHRWLAPGGFFQDCSYPFPPGFGTKPFTQPRI